MTPDRAPWRAKLFAQRFWQPTTACMGCMPGSLANLGSLSHWEVALQTGLVTGFLVLLVSFTPWIGAFRSRAGNACLVAGLTSLGDAYAHSRHGGVDLPEVLLTGVVSGSLAWVASWLLEDGGRRVRSAWSRMTGTGAG